MNNRLANRIQHSFGGLILGSVRLSEPAPPATLCKSVGVNRFVWDLRYDPPDTLPYGYFGQAQEYTEYKLSNDAIVGATPRKRLQGGLALPDTYTVELERKWRRYRTEPKIFAGWVHSIAI